MNTDLIHQLAQGWLDVAEADRQHANAMAATAKAATPHEGERPLSAVDSQMVAERLSAIAWTRNNCAFELKRLLFELQKENPPIGGPLAPETDCESV